MNLIAKQLLFLLLCCSMSVVGQTRLDDYVSVTFPSEPEKLDMPDDHQNAVGYGIADSLHLFAAVRVPVKSAQRNGRAIPINRRTLDGYYRDLITAQISEMESKGFSFVDTAQVITNGFINYKLSYVDSAGNPAAETRILWLDANLYTVVYRKIDSFDVAGKDRFFDSFSVDRDSSPAQISAVSDNNGIGALAIELIKPIGYAAILIILLVFFRKAGKDKSRWGLNFKRVVCPICGTKQPIIRTPKDSDEALWGGTTCPKCQTKLDKFGRVRQL